MTEFRSLDGSSVKLEPVTWVLHDLGLNMRVLLKKHTRCYTVSFGYNYLDKTGKWNYHTDGINCPLFETAEEALTVWTALPQVDKDNPRESR